MDSRGVSNFHHHPTGLVGSRQVPSEALPAASPLPTRTLTLRWFCLSWEWGHMNSQNPIFTDAVADLKSAMAAHDKINPALKMATNGKHKKLIPHANGGKPQQLFMCADAVPGWLVVDH